MILVYRFYLGFKVIIPQSPRPELIYSCLSWESCMKSGLRMTSDWLNGCEYCISNWLKWCWLLLVSTEYSKPFISSKRAWRRLTAGRRMDFQRAAGWLLNLLQLDEVWTSRRWAATGRRPQLEEGWTCCSWTKAEQDNLKLPCCRELLQALLWWCQSEPQIIKRQVLSFDEWHVRFVNTGTSKIIKSVGKVYLLFTRSFCRL